MPKIEAGGDFNFRVNGLPYNRGLYSVVFNKTNTDSLKIVKSDTGESITGGFQDFSQFTDDGDSPYASRAALITALESFFF